MTRQNDSLTALDVIRCVYLARTAHKRGDLASAERWQAKADAWLHETNHPDNLCPTESPPLPT